MRYFSIGSIVKVKEENDNENYNSFRDHKLKIIKVSRNVADHPGYDESINEPLYDLFDLNTKKDIGLSLYYYELEKA